LLDFPEQSYYTFIKTVTFNDKKILVVDDEPDVTDLIEYKLGNEGFDVRSLNNPAEVMREVQNYMPDLVLLDIMMPNLNGIQICKMIRSNTSAVESIPIIFLTAKGETDDRVTGLESGADDYLSKPFNTTELVLRIKSILKRAATPQDNGAASSITVGNVTIDRERHRLIVNGETIILTATEFRLIHVLMSRVGVVQTREELLSHVWNYNSDVETRTVDTHVRRLREKLSTEADIIKTIRGVGYKVSEG